MHTAGSQDGFAKLSCALRVPRQRRIVLGLLLAINTLLLGYSGYAHSPTHNEPGHLVAGLYHWKFGQFELYRVNPPLVRIVAALPVLAVGFSEDWTSYHDGPGARPEFPLGEDFVAANGERSFWLVTLSRWACIPFSWLGALVCYAWARDLFGYLSGILACSIWCFEPNVIGNASVIAPDAHATSLGLAACYTFWLWLRQPGWKQAALTGIVLGLAELAKSTLILFYPIWWLIWVIYRWPDRAQRSRQVWLSEAAQLLLRMGVGLYVLNLGYGFDGTLEQLGQFEFVSDLFTGRADTTPLASPGASQDKAKPNVGNRFRDSWLGRLPVPFPKPYIIGLDVQQFDFEHYSRPSYLLGAWQQSGWWYYYAFALLVKVPLSLWGLILLTILGRILGLTKSIRWRDEAVLLLPALIVFIVVSSKTGINEHMRYVLPCFPFVFIWVSAAASTNEVQAITTSLLLGKKVFQFTVLSMICWLVASSLWIYPHSLSYFNEAIGGPLNGPEYLLGSSVDWGQDLTYLSEWREQQPADTPMILGYYGFFSPGATGFEDTHPFNGSPRDDLPRDNGGVAPSRKFYAVSLNLLYGLPWNARDGMSDTPRIGQDMCRVLRALVPYARIGYSCRVYQLGDDRSALP